jgi:hypothetical protein
MLKQVAFLLLAYMSKISLILASSHHKSTQLAYIIV